MEKKCDECGSRYDTRSRSPNRERFCGKRCYQRYWNQRTAEKRGPRRTIEQLRRRCVMCKQEFVTDQSHPRALTCSRVCNQQRFNAVHRESREQDLVPRHCVECGTEFIAGAIRTKKFCSPRCQQRFNGRLFGRRHRPKIEAYRKKIRWNGNWQRALERDGQQCVRCGGTGRLCVHHIDGTGEDESPNHDLENLATLCVMCHKQIHTLTYHVAEGVIYVQGPVFDWLDINKVKLQVS